MHGALSTCLTLVLGPLERACLLIPQALPNIKSFESPCFRTHPTAHTPLRRHSVLFSAVHALCPHQYHDTWSLFCNPGLLQGEAQSTGLCVWASRHRSETWQMLKGKSNEGKAQTNPPFTQRKPPCLTVPLPGTPANIHHLFSIFPSSSAKQTSNSDWLDTVLGDP